MHRATPTARLSLLCALLLSAAALASACGDDDGATVDPSGIQTAGFQIPGPPCEVGPPQQVNAFGGGGTNRAALSVAALPNGGVVMAGYADLDANTRNGWIGTLDGFGQPLWEVLFPAAFTSGESLLFDGDNVLLIGTDQDPSRQRLLKLNLADGQTLFERTFPGDMGSVRAFWRHGDRYMLAISNIDGTLAMHTLGLDGNIRATQTLTLGGYGSAKLLNNGDAGAVVVPTFDMFAPTEVQSSLASVVQYVSPSGEVLGTFDYSDARFGINHASDAFLLDASTALLVVERVPAGDWITQEVEVIRLDLATMTATSRAVFPLNVPRRSAKLHAVPGQQAAFVTGQSVEPAATHTWRVDLATGTAEELPPLQMPTPGPMGGGFLRGVAATTEGLHMLWEDMSGASWQLKMNTVSYGGEVGEAQTLFVSEVEGTQECVSSAPIRTQDGHRLLVSANCYAGGASVKLWLQQSSCAPM